MPNNNRYVLEVPLDASQVKDFKPDRAVKVIAYGSKAPTREHSVKLDAKGAGKATFTFDEHPGALTIALGPEKATVDQLKGLQTVTVSVPASKWGEHRTLPIDTVPITNYWWWWWWRWCTDYKITGRVVCADGVTPVAGATVCAYDVDWWWWWISKDLVSCAVTAADGSFEIDFIDCCGWWPWWWWETRDWLLEPLLVERIQPILEQANLAMPRPTPTPSLDVFNQILASSAKTGRNNRQALRTSTSGAFDTAALELLRAQLGEVLPREFPLRIWPWWPWWPWEDCSANIIFQVTQTCNGQVNTIVNETVLDTRWGIPTNLNVTLTSNTEACCVYSCPDCPDGNCFVPSDVCGINIGSIAGNIGAPPSTPAQVGLYSPGVQDRPFAEVIDFFGTFGNTSDVDYYEIQYSTTGIGGPYAPLPLPAIGTIPRSVLVVTPGPVFNWVPTPFKPTPISDGITFHNVIETVKHYEANNGPQNWDAFTHDLQVVLNSLNVLSNGTYYLRLAGFQRPGYVGNLSTPTYSTGSNIIPVCDDNPGDPATANYWVVTIDNRAPLPTDPTGQVCGLHICTDQPLSQIVNVYIQHLDGSRDKVEGCSSVCIVDTDKLVVDFSAYDPDEFLDSYTLQLLYGDDQSVNLLNSADPSLAPWSLNPIAVGFAPAASQVGPTYADALAFPELATSPVWGGGSMELIVEATGAFPILPCAYLLQLYVYKRTIVNCDNDDGYWNLSFQTFSVQACVG